MGSVPLYSSIFPHTMGKYKPNLEAFNHRPDREFVIDRFNYIESILTEIIVVYIKPSSDRHDLLKSTILNNSIVSFASKVKLFCHMNATEQWIYLKKDSLHRLMQIRNQFAHSGTQWLIANKDTGESRTRLMLESVSGNGKLEQVDSEVALDEFTQLAVEIRDKLHAVLKKLKGE